MQGRDSCRLDLATSTKEQKYDVYRTLPVLKSGTFFTECLKCHFSEEMVGFFDFLLVRRLFISVRHSKNRI